MLCGVGTGFWCWFGFVDVGFFLLGIELYFSTLSISQSGEKSPPLQYYHEEDIIPMTMESPFSTNRIINGIKDKYMAAAPSIP